MQQLNPTPNKQLPLIALCLGFFMVIIDVTIVNVALPSMAENLHVGMSGLQWVVAGYTFDETWKTEGRVEEPAVAVLRALFTKYIGVQSFVEQVARSSNL